MNKMHLPKQNLYKPYIIFDKVIHVLFLIKKMVSALLAYPLQLGQLPITSIALPQAPSKSLCPNIFPLF